MPRTRRDEVDECQTLALHGLAHQHVRLKENVFLTHAGNGWNDAGVGRIVDRIEHVQAELLMLG